MEKILEKSGKSQGILSVRKSGNPVIPILTFVLTGDIHRSVYASGRYGDSVPGWLQNTILLGMGMH